jgi:hypothetical protein
LEFACRLYEAWKIPDVKGVTLQRHHDKQQEQELEAVIENVNLEEGDVNRVPFHPQYDLLRHHAELEVFIYNGNLEGAVGGDYGIMHKRYLDWLNYKIFVSLEKLSATVGISLV